MEKAILRQVKFRPQELHIDYDEGNDVPYLSFGKPKAAYDPTLPEEGVIYRLSGDQLVGMTILNFRGKTQARRKRNKN